MPHRTTTLRGCSILVLAAIAVAGTGCDKTRSTEKGGAGGAATGGQSMATGASSSVSVAPSTAASASGSAQASASTGAVPSAPPADRAAYVRAMAEGRKHTAAKRYDDAVAAFTRALAASADDARALSERGYARHLKGDDAGAKADFERASASCDPRDKKLAAMIEYNLGLACDALADRGIGDQLRGAAVGHYRRSNELSPTKAAAGKMGGCPASWGPPKTETFPSLAEGQARIDKALAEKGEWRALEDKSPIMVRDRTTDGTTSMLLPIDAGRVAHVVVGNTQLWHCGVLGVATATRIGDVWKLEYQAHHGGMGAGVCMCDDAVCTTEWSANRDDPACKCSEPFCPLSCGPADLPEGEHTETFVDARTGAGIWRVAVDHAYASAVVIDTDLAQRRFRASGLGCVADVALGAGK
jgi:hypothetical protein